MINIGAVENAHTMFSREFRGASFALLLHHLANDFHAKHFCTITEARTPQHEHCGPQFRSLVNWPRGNYRADYPGRMALVHVTLHTPGKLIIDGEESDPHSGISARSMFFVLKALS